MTKAKFIPVILSGGAGTRLWPLSRHHYPKQFIPLFGDKNLFTLTLERVVSMNPEHIVVICNEAHRFMVMEYLRGVKGQDCTIIAEPESRNTAPAIALASFWIRSRFEEMPMLILPSDHYMKENEFNNYINDEAIYAATDYFITFGIKPTRAERGYGYIKVNNKKPSTNGKEQSKVQLTDVSEFIEKPDQARAEAYIKTGLHYWNSGIFLFKANNYLSALQQYQLEIYDACDKALGDDEGSLMDGYRIIKPKAKYFKQNPDISIDYAVMEHVENIRLCPMDIHWSDLGSWQALSEIQAKDDNENSLVGKGNIVTEDAKNNIIYADNKLVVCLGIDNHLVVETKDAVLITDRKHGEELKQLVGKLREKGHTESDLHTKVYRPWGSYESVDTGSNFQVKRIIVNPGQRLSLQSHKRRAEHWVVVKGRAKVTVDDKILDLHINQSAYIPIGAKHRLENEGTEPLHLIEVQCGDYLGEDDIERYEDNYGRVNE